MRALMIAGVMLAVGLVGAVDLQADESQSRMGACLVNGAAKIPRAPGLALGTADIKNLAGDDMVKVLEDATFSYEINSGELQDALYVFGTKAGNAFDEARSTKNYELARKIFRANVIVSVKGAAVIVIPTVVAEHTVKFRVICAWNENKTMYVSAPTVVD